MANIYSISSFTLRPKVLGESLKLGKLATCFIGSFSRAGAQDEFVVDLSECGSDQFSDIVSDLNITFQLSGNSVIVKDLVDELIHHKVVNQATADKLLAFLSWDTSLDSDYSVSLGDLLACCFEEDDSNLAYVFEECASYCDRNRHGEFGGYGCFWSAEFNDSTSSSELANLPMTLSTSTPQVAIGDYLQNNLRGQLHRINNVKTRKAVTESIIKLLTELQRQWE